MSDSPASPRRFDFIAMGRAAVDLYGEQIGGRLEDMTSFAKYVGGCPANISIGAARLGLKPAMLTRVGDEHMGRFVRETLAAEGVDVSHVKTDPERLTALVILGIRDRETFPLIFYRENCADMAIAPEDFDRDFIASATALIVTGTHFSTAAIDRTCRAAIRHARASGTKVALDIDYRPVLWGLTGRGLGEERFVASASVSAHLQSIVPDCALIVGTEEEIHIAGGTTDTLAAVGRLRELSAATIVVKRGPQGCVVFPGPIPARLEDGIVGPGSPVEVFNVLGAGDAFMAGLLRGWLRGEDWETAAAYANACGALVVSRHGCAPAMPSWTELNEFLGREDRPFRLFEDAHAAEIHRVTTRARAWPEVAALAFDHRAPFEALAARHGAAEERIMRFKALAAEAFREVAARLPSAGAIIDERYGEQPLFALTGGGAWLARPIERPGATPLEFEGGPDVAVTLRAWPAEHVVKCLAFHHPDMPAEPRDTQEERLATLFRGCVATGHELLVEIIPPRDFATTGAGLAGSLARLYDRSIRPEWWKLPACGAPADWRAIADVVRARDPWCRGILILGQEGGEARLKRAFAAASGEPLVRGFAVGRDIFWAPAEAWFAGSADDRATVAAIAANYRRMIALWRDRARG